MRPNEKVGHGDMLPPLPPPPPSPPHLVSNALPEGSMPLLLMRWATGWDLQSGGGEGAMCEGKAGEERVSCVRA